MKFHVIIPARYASTRLPGKPLEDLQGLPMVVRVLRRCSASGAATVQVATDSEAVAQAVRAHEGSVVMTAAHHASGTDRLAEAAQALALKDEDIVVNVQGDEPLIPPAVIDQVAANLAANPECSVATLCEAISRREDIFNPNVVKVVPDARGRALYFSRAPLPWHRDAFAAGSGGELPGQGQWWRHIGLYAYRVGLLRRFVQWPPAPLEQVESLEQLRVLFNGEAIHVAQACEPVPAGVDTPADLARMRDLQEFS